jgi:hypothetical protein
MAETETGWIIRLKPSVWPTGAYYGENGEGALGWTADHTRAIRFARKEDAELVIRCEGFTDACAAEHGWASDRLPSIGVSLQPAIPRRVAPQQSPLPLHQSPPILPQIPVRRRNQIARLNLTAGIQSRSPFSCPSPTGCHLYLARRVPFLSCADIQRARMRQKDRISW